MTRTLLFVLLFVVGSAANLSSQQMRFWFPVDLSTATLAQGQTVRLLSPAPMAFTIEELDSESERVLLAVSFGAAALAAVPSQLPPPPVDDTCIFDCFTASTLVLAADGRRRSIATLRPDDRILDADGVARTVRRVRQGRSPCIVELRVGAETIETTRGHRFWTAQRGVVPAGELVPGDLLRTASGVVKLSAVSLRDRLAAPVRVYDLELADGGSILVGHGAVVAQAKCGRAPVDAGLRERQSAYSIDIQ